MSELEDLEEIRQLLARYCHTVDSGDSEGFAGCFTEDGVFDANGDLSVGRDALRKTCDGYRPLHEVTPMRHYTENSLITVKGDEAEVSSYLFGLAAGEQPRVLFTGTYRDRLRRVGGRWLISERVGRSDVGQVDLSSGEKVTPET